MSSPLVAGIEAGGTKFICGVGHGPEDILRTRRIATTRPEETLAEVIDFFKAAEADLGEIGRMGVASFGPLELDPASPAYGCITNTPKPGWSGFDLRGTMERALGLPVAIDTDVAGAGLAEWRLGGGRGLASMAYVTMGTGIGAALIVGGRPLLGLGHPEVGHVPVQRHPIDRDFPGHCPFHGDCLEGLAAGPSVVARYGVSLSDLPPDALIWEALADYAAQLCLTLTLAWVPHRIILGGGVMSAEPMLARVRQAFLARNNGYASAVATPEAVGVYLAPPSLGDRAGLAGAMLLAEKAGA